MAKRTSILDIEGFEEFYEKLQQASMNAEREAKKCLDECGQILKSEIETQAKKAELEPYLLNEMFEDKVSNSGIWSYEVGWRKPNITYKGELPDTYKVLFYNYGTPSNRYTRSGENRGQEQSHPQNSKGFIHKAKISARRKVKKKQKEYFDKIITRLEK